MDWEARERERIEELKEEVDEIEEEIGIEVFVNVVEEEGVKKREISEKIRRCEELRRKYVEKTTELERRSHGKSSTFKKVEEDITSEIERMKNMRTKIQNEKIDGKEKVGAKVKAADAKKQVHVKKKARVVNDAATSANRDENGKTAERSEKINIKRKARAKDKAAAKAGEEAAAAIAQKDDEEAKDCKACKDEDEAKNGNNDENEAKAGRNDKDKNAKKGEDDEEEGKTAKVARNEDEPSEDEESTVYKLMKEYESDSEDKTTEDKLNKRYPEENDEDYVPSEEESKESIEYNSDAEISQDVEASQDAGDSQAEVERQEAVESPEYAEVVTRCAKNIFTVYLRGLDMLSLSCEVFHFLNCLVSVEGQLEFRTFLFVPKPTPFYLFENKKDKDLTEVFDLIIQNYHVIFPDAVHESDMDVNKIKGSIDISALVKSTRMVCLKHIDDDHHIWESSEEESFEAEHELTFGPGSVAPLLARTGFAGSFVFDRGWSGHAR